MDKRKTDNETPMPDYKKCKLDNDNDNATKTIELPIENKKRKTDNDVIDVKKEKLYNDRNHIESLESKINECQTIIKMLSLKISERTIDAKPIVNTIAKPKSNNYDKYNLYI
jgi:hypothetical protein